MVSARPSQLTFTVSLWLITGAPGTGSMSTISAPAGMTTILFRFWSDPRATVAYRIVKRPSGIYGVEVVVDSKGIPGSGRSSVDRGATSELERAETLLVQKTARAGMTASETCSTDAKIERGESQIHRTDAASTC
jgi:hypothetical protein